jgi:hypothetical protein
MSFEDELKELVLEAKAEQERREKELTEFRDDWQFARLNTVKPAFDTAVKVIESDTHFRAATELKNGSIHLSIGRQIAVDKYAVINELTLKPNEEKLEIECSDTRKYLVPESFNLESLDHAVVESKVKQFLSAVLA